MILQILVYASFCLAALPFLLFLANLPLFRRAPNAFGSASASAGVSILIPARNEEGVIRQAVLHALASSGVEVEVVVLDDDSNDGTGAEVEALSKFDPRVRLISGSEPERDWCGKQLSCWTLASNARFDDFLFLDADVQIAPDAAVRALAFRNRSKAALVSGFPRQATHTLAERLVIPLIQFVLLGFLPLAWMRRSLSRGFAAGCGQFFLTDRQSYFRAGGHEAIKSSRHDGITLPRAFRSAGLATDVFDACDIAECRMYRGLGELWRGLAKNATEGMASARLIVPFTILLFGGQVLPFFLLIASYVRAEPTSLAVAAVFLAYTPRFLAALRFQQSLVGALLHPLGVLMLLVIQWHAFVRKCLGLPESWRGRTFDSKGATPSSSSSSNSSRSPSPSRTG
jgi:glycosyltransferase involved in cell wall biosynthesis